MSGQAWERGTDIPDVLHGMQMKFTVLKNEDIEKLDPEVRHLLNYAIGHYQKLRRKEGKKENTYLMINMDEPYIGEVIEIMKKHGHWG